MKFETVSAHLYFHQKNRRPTRLGATVLAGLRFGGENFGNQATCNNLA
jgi:hypothetical protein